MKNKYKNAIVEQDEIESRKAVRRFRNAYITGVMVRKTVKWGLIAIGTATVIGAFSNDNDKNETEKI